MQLSRALGCALGTAAVVLALSGTAPAPSTDPNDVAVATLTGGEPGNAESLATQIIDNESASAEARAQAFFTRGLARDQLGEREDALVDFTQALWLKVLPADQTARVLYDRGVTLDQLGRTHEAMGDYTGALKFLPGFAAALNNRGNLYRRAGQLKLAQRDYRAALAAGDPQKEYPYFGLAQIAEAQHHYAHARVLYHLALDANPNYADASVALAALSEPKAVPGVLANVTHRRQHRAPKPVEQLATASFEVPAITPKPAPPPPAPQPPPQPDLRASIADSDTAGTPAANPPPAAPAKPVTAPQAVASAAKPAPKPARAAIAAVAMAGPQIQLGAWRDEADAAEGWNKIAAVLGDVLHNLTPHIVAADLPGKGRYYRLRAALADGQDASELCGAVRAHGFACMAVKA